MCVCVRACGVSKMSDVSEMSKVYFTDGISKPDGGPSQTVEGLFGDAADLSSS